MEHSKLYVVWLSLEHTKNNDNCCTVTASFFSLSKREVGNTKQKIVKKSLINKSNEGYS